MGIANTFLKNLVLGGALNIVRGYLNKSIGKFTPDDLYDAINQNRDLWTVTPPELKTQGQQFKQKYKNLFEQYSHELNTEVIMDWIRQDHPDLFSVLIQPDPTSLNKPPPGLIWLDRQVIRIKREIMGM